MRASTHRSRRPSLHPCRPPDWDFEIDVDDVQCEEVDDIVRDPSSPPVSSCSARWRFGQNTKNRMDSRLHVDATPYPVCPSSSSSELVPQLPARIRCVQPWRKRPQWSLSQVRAEFVKQRRHRVNRCSVAPFGDSRSS